jgi:hypothetical protein
MSRRCSFRCVNDDLVAIGMCPSQLIAPQFLKSVLPRHPLFASLHCLLPELLAAAAGAPVPPAWAVPLMALPAAVAAIAVTLGQHTQTLAQHTLTLAQHTLTLAQHTQTLAQHTQTLGQHTLSLGGIKETLGRVHNASALMDGHALERVCLPNGNAIPAATWFPATRGDLMGPNLTNARANALLVAYGLPAMPGANDLAINAKRVAIAIHIGIRIL